MCRRGQGSGSREPEPGSKLWAWREPHLALMAFLVSGTLQAAAQLVDAWDSVGRKVVRCSTWPSPFPTPSWPPAQHSSAFPFPGEIQCAGFKGSLDTQQPRGICDGSCCPGWCVPGSGL